MKKLVNGKLVDMTPAEEAEFLAGQEVPTPATRRFSKRLLFGAMTDEQYSTWKQVQTQQPERLQAVFAAATELNESDPDWSILLGLMNTYLGEAETAALLDAAAIEA